MSEFLAQIEAVLPVLWRYAYSLTRNRDAADDLVQDCVERAIRKRDLWTSDGSLKSWLMTILVNLYRNQLRGAKNRPMAAMDDLASEPAAADTLTGKLALGDAARALSNLPVEQREALLLVVLSGLSYKEAAASLGIPIGTLMSRLGRARANMRAAVSETNRSEPVS